MSTRSPSPPDRSAREAAGRSTPAHLGHLVARPESARAARSPAPAARSPALTAAPSPAPAAATAEASSRRPHVERPHDPALLSRIVAATPSRVAVGRTGSRYRTATYLELRADHAIAKDAVYAELPVDLGARLGCIEVVSRCPDREHYLLHPNDGRRLSDACRARLAAEGERGTDVVVILGDGLAAPALALNGPPLLPALYAALAAVGLRVARPILARMARVGLQDDIGVLLGCKATAICLGERPGLGTGDSLSIYTAVGPRLDQDNAEKNCISNIRPQGLAPEQAALQAASLLQRGIAAGRGGLAMA